MITLTLKWMGRLKEIEFPCTDTELQAKLADLRPPDASPAEIFVSSVEEPTALCMLETQFVKITPTSRMCSCASIMMKQVSPQPHSCAPSSPQ